MHIEEVGWRASTWLIWRRIRIGSRITKTELYTYMLHKMREIFYTSKWPVTISSSIPTIYLVKLCFSHSAKISFAKLIRCTINVAVNIFVNSVTNRQFFSGAVTTRQRPHLDGRIVDSVPVNIEDFPYQVKLWFSRLKFLLQHLIFQAIKSPSSKHI